ncbi:MAG: hypothetical protein N2117_15005 [Anaerolineales bacterium]|nr:hypothetical protein [Anaerolineales bacterium]MCX7756535.1 hypothetical protein [Anaerolineales bacterium]MDW8279388.1 hypothetical protein [Anaerolineales bacterium]
MNQTLYVIFDGRAFVPEGKVKLRPNQRYLIRIESEIEPEQPATQVLKQLATQAIDTGISDLAEQHDHYLYGTKKR